MHMNNFARRLVLSPRQMKKTTQEWPIGGLGVCCNLVPRAFTLAWGQDKGPGNEVDYQLLFPPLLVKPVFSIFQSLDSDPCFTRFRKTVKTHWYGCSPKFSFCLIIQVLVLRIKWPIRTKFQS